ncbi:yeats-domain-containing protein [Tilletiaria anomala UBC 951]|uniref:Protein AF-9 homolog n=1 Tax=Tilletiaria anomala (strain ATCC 24038 / CBS 436.72 / UBC 951) TaxID=1037660 RepID=A0A066W2B7_TILAU|nr:yeats-domain-containing protein [Tilletiaria anomala UBC 951]KDN44910.1 yeats-domain-containing protein [Tilletiaria anomala UBC 951]
MGSSGTKRIRGLSISRPLLVGTTATLLSPADRIVSPPDHTHRWTVAVRSAASYPLPPVQPLASVNNSEEAGGISTRGRETEADYHKMVGGKDDISYFIKRVQFKLHETYAQATRNIDKPPFQVTETGWGEFEIQIKVFFIPEANEKPVTFFHHLKLHPWLPPASLLNPPAELAPPAANQHPADPAAAGAHAASTAASAPAEALSAESAVPPDAMSSVVSTSSAAVDPEASIPVPSTPSETVAPALSAAAPAAVTAPLQPMPTLIEQPPVVHSWQYEEIVFPEPTEAFYEILVAHPPSPLPASSAQAFTDPSAYNAYSAKKAFDMTGTSAAEGANQTSPGLNVPPHPLHNPAGQLFDALSQEAIASETKRLDDARIAIVNEIERGRLTLIQRERELRNLKTKVAAAV